MCSITYEEGLWFCFALYLFWCMNSSLWFHAVYQVMFLGVISMAKAKSSDCQSTLEDISTVDSILNHSQTNLSTMYYSWDFVVIPKVPGNIWPVIKVPRSTWIICIGRTIGIIDTYGNKHSAQKGGASVSVNTGVTGLFCQGTYLCLLKRNISISYNIRINWVLSAQCRFTLWSWRK